MKPVKGRDSAIGASTRKKKFAALVVELDNPTEAAWRVYDLKSRAGARVKASGLMKDKEVQLYINKALDVRGLSPEYVLGRLKRIAQTGKESNQLKALDMIGKHLKMWGDKKDSSKFNFNIELTSGQADKILRSTEGYLGQGESRVEVVCDNDAE